MCTWVFDLSMGCQGLSTFGHLLSNKIKQGLVLCGTELSLLCGQLLKVQHWQGCSGALEGVSGVWGPSCCTRTHLTMRASALTISDQLGLALLKSLSGELKLVFTGRSDARFV